MFARSRTRKRERERNAAETGTRVHGVSGSECESGSGTTGASAGERERELIRVKSLCGSAAPRRDNPNFVLRKLRFMDFGVAKFSVAKVQHPFWTSVLDLTHAV